MPLPAATGVTSSWLRCRGARCRRSRGSPTIFARPVDLNRGTGAVGEMRLRPGRFRSASVWPVHPSLAEPPCGSYRAATSRQVSGYSGPQTPRSIERRPAAAIRSAWPEKTGHCAEKSFRSRPEAVGFVSADPRPRRSPRARLARTPTASLLRNLNASVEELTAQGVPERRAGTDHGLWSDRRTTRCGDTGLVIGRQRAIGSGAIVDPDGYIITNAHVVAGARRVQVVLHRDTTSSGPVRSLATSGRARQSTRASSARRTTSTWRCSRLTWPGLRALPLAEYDAIRQGEIVFAFGSPEGLRNSVTMGVVSWVARQPDPDSPTIYIQTDAPINPATAGGRW